ncbi:MAG: hypothetical protein ACD_28C00303G0004 [uncultured bacterium]|nr:MAG: hypothetical protein ACD_28C00303G0004 [uncultured bacterium]KKT76789.1 MAG: hypothetical protein UW70_C0013G0007 [Candidatus Peregrinibacteria bacterium GW2011_GWA2_44_7]
MAQEKSTDYQPDGQSIPIPKSSRLVREVLGKAIIGASLKAELEKVNNRAVLFTIPDTDATSLHHEG